jgi:hypothetical protein
LTAAGAEFCNDGHESASDPKFAFAGALRNHFAEKSIAVLGDRLCPLRFTRVADAASGRDRCALRNQRSCRTPFAQIRRESFRSRRICASAAAVYCEILLAALLIMCNAAENFLPLR